MVIVESFTLRFFYVGDEVACHGDLPGHRHHFHLKHIRYRFPRLSGKRR